MPFWSMNPSSPPPSFLNHARTVTSVLQNVYLWGNYLGMTSSTDGIILQKAMTLSAFSKGKTLSAFFICPPPPTSNLVKELKHLSYRCRTLAVRMSACSEGKRASGSLVKYTEKRLERLPRKPKKDLQVVGRWSSLIVLRLL